MMQCKEVNEHNEGGWEACYGVFRYLRKEGEGCVKIQSRYDGGGENRRGTTKNDVQPVRRM